MSPGSGGTRLFVLLGAPVDHSLSPAIHAAAFRELGEDAAYAALEVKAGEVAPVMRAVSRSGGGNVTLPHKERAAAALDRRTGEVEATDACNTFWRDAEGHLVGDNTDVAGFLAALEGLVPDATADGREGAGGLEGRQVLLLGAGGAARAVLHGLLRGGTARVDVSNRTPERARAMVEEVAPGGGARVLPDREGMADRYDLVVNATSLGMDRRDPLPLELGEMEVGAVFDLVYGARGTRWTRHARELGIPARDGLEMLVRQAAASLRCWLGRPPPVEAMRQAARAAARGRDDEPRGREGEA